MSGTLRKLQGVENMFLAINQAHGTLMYYISFTLEVMPLFLALYVLYFAAQAYTVSTERTPKLGALMTLVAMPVFLFAQYGQLDALVNDVLFIRQFFDSAWLIFNTSVMGALLLYAKHTIQKQKG